MFALLVEGARETDLDRIVAEAKAAVEGKTAGDVRADGELQTELHETFTRLQGEIDNLMVTRKPRAITLDEEPAEA